MAQGDYLRYLALLEEWVPHCECRLHALALMTNHVHLLLTPLRPESPGLLMKHVGQRYTQYVNRRYSRTGTLWEGRFHSCLAQASGYALACYRYIEMNPVRAGIVRTPAEYLWSSYSCNALGKPWSLISPHGEYLQLGEDDAARRSAYLGLFQVEPDSAAVATIRRATKGNVVIGDVNFVLEVENALGRRVTARPHGRPRKPGPNDG
jgi:putative transposase